VTFNSIWRVSDEATTVKPVEMSDESAFNTDFHTLMAIESVIDLDSSDSTSIHLCTACSGIVSIRSLSLLHRPHVSDL
jgi:hypothetical protein